jgi:hypothetical protein
MKFWQIYFHLEILIKISFRMHELVFSRSWMLSSLENSKYSDHYFSWAWAGLCVHSFSRSAASNFLKTNVRFFDIRHCMARNNNRKEEIPIYRRKIPYTTFLLRYTLLPLCALAVCLCFSDGMTSLLRSSSRKGEVPYQESSVCINRGRFPFAKKKQFAFPECPVAKWNAAA